MVHLLKGKCYDKSKQYEMAIEHYTQALKMAKKQSDLVRGNMLFRLGWAKVRSKREIEKGVQLLEQAAVLIPDNCEILLKLAGAIF